VSVHNLRSFVLLWDYRFPLCLCCSFACVHRFACRLVVYCEVGSIPEGAITRPREDSFLRDLLLWGGQTDGEE
jgi:hypothetical protein